MDHFQIEPLNPIFFRLGTLTVHWYGFLILIGIGLGIVLASREGIKKGFDKDLFWDLATFGVPVAILGTRIYYVLFNLDFYLRHPGRIFAVWEGGLAIHGGVIAAGLFGWWCLRKKKLPFFPIFDIVAMSFFVGQIIGRFGNFMNQEAYGRVIYGGSLDVQRSFLESLFIPDFIVDNMFINGNYHHPTFLYEALWNLVGLLLVIFVLLKSTKILLGEIAAFYAVWYSVGRFFIEALRTDSLMIGPLMQAQVISIVTVVVVLFVVASRRMKQVNMVTYHDYDFAAINEQKQREKREKRKAKRKK